ncbi:hypothetical protein KEM56_001350 [Ascosphaera pollenicola]|nr:hypothetical protein KEM56_001350 [Ascosphaera pollenicola]
MCDQGKSENVIHSPDLEWENVLQSLDRSREFHRGSIKDRHHYLDAKAHIIQRLLNEPEIRGWKVKRIDFKHKDVSLIIPGFDHNSIQRQLATMLKTKIQKIGASANYCINTRAGQRLPNFHRFPDATWMHHPSRQKGFIEIGDTWSEPILQHDAKEWFIIPRNITVVTVKIDDQEIWIQAHTKLDRKDGASRCGHARVMKPKFPDEAPVVTENELRFPISSSHSVEFTDQDLLAMVRDVCQTSDEQKKAILGSK